MICLERCAKQSRGAPPNIFAQNSEQSFEEAK
jgi:hypothetical protein